MAIHLIVFHIILSCMFGGLAVIGILYPKIRTKIAENEKLDIGISVPRENLSVEPKDNNIVESNCESGTEEVKSFSLKLSVVYCVIAFVFTVFVALWLLFHFNSSDIIYMAKRVLLVSLLFVATYYDKLAYRIPNKLILYGLGCRVVLLIFELIFSSETISAVLMSEVIAAGALLVFSVIGLLVTKNGIGMGDIKLFVLMGLLQGVTGVISSVFASLVVSFVYSVFLLITRKKGRKDFIALAPCVLVGTVFSIMLSGA